MNIRKILNLPSAEQTLILLADVELISKRCAEVGKTERKEQIENQKSRNERCPKCRAKQDMIVDKIAQVDGRANFRGNLFKLTGRLDVETKPVNHCNTCGHQWEKFKTKTITDLAIMKVILNYLSDVIRNPEKQSKYSWKLEAIEIFNGCSAEAIYEVQNKYKHSVRYPLSLKQIRKKYKSVFDGKDEVNNNSSSKP
jgi:hypothetical protein